MLVSMYTKSIIKDRKKTPVGRKLSISVEQRPSSGRIDRVVDLYGFIVLLVFFFFGC